MQRLRNVFRSAVAGDVARLREAVGEYKENTSRLECQKQLLLKQVWVQLNPCSTYLGQDCLQVHETTSCLKRQKQSLLNRYVFLRFLQWDAL